MKRGKTWVAAGGSYTGNPRPVVIVQDDRIEETNSVTVCAITGDSTEAPLLRIAVSANPDNGLVGDSHVMIDKISTIRRECLNRRIGNFSAMDMRRIDWAILVILGIAG